MYQTEHDELFASIRSGKPINDGVRMANTTLMAMLGRMATYTGQEISWEQALNSQERLDARARRLEHEDRASAAGGSRHHEADLDMRSDRSRHETSGEVTLCSQSRIAAGR